VLGKRFVKEGTKDRLGFRDSRWEEIGPRRLRTGCGLGLLSPSRERVQGNGVLIGEEVKT